MTAIEETNMEKRQDDDKITRQSMLDKNEAREKQDVVQQVLRQNCRDNISRVLTG